MENSCELLINIVSLLRRVRVEPGAVLFLTLKKIRFMEKQVYVLMRRQYRWTPQGSLMTPCANPILGIWADCDAANKFAAHLVATELTQMPEGVSLKVERHPKQGRDRHFIMLDNKPYSVYDILQYEVRL